MYETWFQFSNRPFPVAPRAESYYPAAGIQAAWEGTESCLDRGNGPALVIGDTGTGKSLFAGRLRQLRSSQQTVALVQGHRSRNNQAFLQQLLYEFGLPHPSGVESDLRMSLTESITYHAQTQSASLLIVDDANLLETSSLEELQGLSNLTYDDGFCLQLVLLGSTSLEEQLGRPQLASLNQRITTRGYLSHWTLADTLGFVRAQVDRVTDRIEIFDENAIRAIHRHTQGVPRLIAQTCDHALVLTAAAHLPQVTPEIAEDAWADLQQLPARRTSLADATTRESMGILAGLATAPSPAQGIEDPTLKWSGIEFGSLDDEPSAVPQTQPVPQTGAIAVEDNPGTTPQPQEDASWAPHFAAEDPSLPPENAHSNVPDTEAAGEETETTNANIPAAAGSEMQPITGADDAPHRSHEDVERDMDAVIDHLDQVHTDLDQAGAESGDEAGDDAHLVPDGILEGVGNYTPAPDPSADASNPFLEEFAEEEIVFLRSAPVSATQPQNSVETAEGQALHQALQRHGAAHGASVTAATSGRDVVVGHPVGDGIATGSQHLNDSGEIDPHHQVAEVQEMAHDACENQTNGDSERQRAGSDEPAHLESMEDQTFADGQVRAANQGGVADGDLLIREVVALTEDCVTTSCEDRQANESADIDATVPFGAATTSAGVGGYAELPELDEHAVLSQAIITANGAASVECERPKPFYVEENGPLAADSASGPNYEGTTLHQEVAMPSPLDDAALHAGAFSLESADAFLAAPAPMEVSPHVVGPFLAPPDQVGESCDPTSVQADRSSSPAEGIDDAAPPTVVPPSPHGSAETFDPQALPSDTSAPGRSPRRLSRLFTRLSKK